MATTAPGLSAQEFQQREIELNGWPVKLTSYRIGDKYVCQAENLSPGACLARFAAPTLGEAESQAISKAAHLLGKTKRRDVTTSSAPQNS
jgi:hypothetical protein